MHKKNVGGTPTDAAETAELPTRDGGARNIVHFFSGTAVFWPKSFFM